MRLYIALLIAALMLSALTGCSAPSENDDGFSEYPPPPDVDLTALSSTMVFAEVYNIMAHPDDYMGKTVKMSGEYYASYDEYFKKHYRFVVIEDATACCQQGLEFTVQGEGGASYEDYPPDGSTIVLTGVFSSYEESGFTHYYIVTDAIHVLQ